MTKCYLILFHRVYSVMFYNYKSGFDFRIASPRSIYVAQFTGSLFRTSPETANRPQTKALWLIWPVLTTFQTFVGAVILITTTEYLVVPYRFRRFLRQVYIYWSTLLYWSQYLAARGAIRSANRLHVALSFVLMDFTAGLPSNRCNLLPHFIASWIARYFADYCVI